MSARKTGSQTHYEWAAPKLKNRLLEAEYYRDLTSTKEDEPRVDKRFKTTEELTTIANHIRKRGKTAAIRDLRCSNALADFVIGEMYLGKLGGF